MDVGFITKSNKILVSLFFCKYLVRIDSAFALSKTINIRAQQMTLLQRNKDGGLAVVSSGEFSSCVPYCLVKGNYFGLWVGWVTPSIRLVVWVRYLKILGKSPLNISRSKI